MIFCLFGSSCKSRKKAYADELAYFGEPVEMPRDKDKHKNKAKTVGEEIVNECITWIGTPYGYGRNEKGVATDCSGMVVIVYRDIAGIKLPRNSAEQADYCHEIKGKEVKAGDLVFFATGKDKHKVSHVGVMIDKDQFVHASGSKGVIISEMTTPYYSRSFLRYGRVPGIK